MTKRGNGEGSIRHNVERGRWEARLTIGTDPSGRLVRRMVTARTKGQLLERMKSARYAADAGLTPVRHDHTVGRFLDEWARDVLPGSVAHATEAQYRDVVTRYLAPRIGRKRLRTLSARDVSAMLADMSLPDAKRDSAGRPAGPYSPTARRLARSVLRRALRYAEAEGLVTRNAAAIAHGVKLERAEGRAMTPVQARAFLDSIRGDRLEAAFVVMLTCGLRLSELLGLAWDCVDIDSDRPALVVRRGLKRVPGSGLVLDDVKTNRSRRTIHLPAPAVSVLRVHRREQAAERLRLGARWPTAPLGADLVFRTGRGNAIDPSGFWKALGEATESAGLGHWHPHELRHSAASLLLAQGVPLKVISEMLGHSSIVVTADVYGHLLDDARAEAAAAMNRALSV
jgi:integrase